MDSERREILGALCRLGLISADQTPRMTALAGGVSSDIWRVDLAEGSICVKRALPKLKVAAQWQVPVERNTYEHAWMETVSRICPQAVPRVIGHDRKSGLFAMAYLDPSEYPVWKAQLREGRACDVGWNAIISARSGESEDVTIVHLAVGWGVRQIKVGSLTRSERTAKWNEALRIKEALGSKARFAGADAILSLV